MPAIAPVSPSDIRLEVRLLDDLLKLNTGDDLTDRIELSSFSFPTSAFTWEGWYRFDQITTAIMPLLSYAIAGNSNEVLLGFDEPNDRFEIHIAGSSDISTTLSALTANPLDGNVHHFAVTWDSSDGSWQLYIDYGLEASGTVSSGASITTGGTLMVGQEQDSVGGGFVEQQTFRGIARELRLWSDVRTESEIIDNADAQITGSETGLELYWRVDEGTGTTIADTAGANDGTLTGGTWITGPSPLWHDLWPDVLAEHITSFGYGNQDLDPRSRAAVGGMADFTLDNDGETNSAGVDGLYSQGHANALEGWTSDLEVRLTIEKAGANPYRKYRGWIQTITPAAGKYNKKIAEVKVGDWFAFASELHPRGLDVLESATGDDILDALLDALDHKPDRRDFDVGKSTFDYALDEVRDGNTTAFVIANNVALSELGRVYQAGDQRAGGVMRFENRHSRVLNTSLLVTLDQDFAEMVVEDDMGLVYTVVRAQANPRDVDADPTHDLFELQGDPLEIGGNSTEEIEGKYSDPNNRDARVAGLDMTDPEGLNALVDEHSETDRTFESGVGSWNPTTGVTLSQSSDEAKKGKYSAKAVADAGTGVRRFIHGPYIAAVQNDVVQFQAYVKVDDAWPHDFDIRVQEAAAGVNQVITFIETIATPTSGWVRVCFEYTVSDVDTDKIRLLVGYPGGSTADFAGGETFYVDEAYAIHDENLNYEFSSTAAGGGDLNTALEMIESTIGGNAAQFVLHNTDNTTGFVTVLTATGKRVLVYQPQTANSEVDEEAEGKEFPRDRTLSVVLPYLTSVLEAQDFADNLLSRHKNRKLRVRSVTFFPTRTSTLFDAFLDGEPGDRIALKDDPTGIDDEFFINGVDFEIMADDKLRATWYVEEAGASDFWLIGEVGASEIGETTVVGF